MLLLEKKQKESETDRAMAVAQKQRDGPPISSLMVPDLEYELRFFSDIVRPSRMKKRATPPKTKEKLFQKGTSGSGFNTTTAKHVRIIYRIFFFFFPCFRWLFFLLGTFDLLFRDKHCN
jgi:hypothetical protein